MGIIFRAQAQEPQNPKTDDGNRQLAKATKSRQQRQPQSVVSMVAMVAAVVVVVTVVVVAAWLFADVGANFGWSKQQVKSRDVMSRSCATWTIHTNFVL